MASRGSAEEALLVARRLVALARRQHEALRRESMADFQASGQRRDEAASQLREIAPNSRLRPKEARLIQTLRTELQQLDAGMEDMLQARLAAIQTSQRGLRRSKKVLDSYSSAAPPAPSFIDKKR